MESNVQAGMSCIDSHMYLWTGGSSLNYKRLLNAVMRMSRSAKDSWLPFEWITLKESERKADMIVGILWWVALSLWFKSIFLLYIIIF